MSRTRLQKLSEIVVLLREKTEAGRVRWRREGDEDARRLMAKIGDNAVRLELHQYKKNGSAVADIRVTFLNDDGDVTDTVRDADLEPITPPGKHFGWQTYMTETLELAERWALGSDRVLDEIFEALQSDAEEEGEEDDEEEDNESSSEESKESSSEASDKAETAEASDS